MTRPRFHTTESEVPVVAKKEPFMVRTKQYWKRPWNEYSWQQQVFVLGLLASPIYILYKKNEDFRDEFDYWYENAGQEARYILQDHVLSDRDHFVSEEDLLEAKEELMLQQELDRERSVDQLIAQEPPKKLELATTRRVRDIVFPWDWPTVKAFLLYPFRPVENDYSPPAISSDPPTTDNNADGAAQPDSTSPSS